MSRPPISMSLPGVMTYTVNSNGSTTNYVVGREQITESSSGTARHKPVGWIPPTAYSLFSTYRRGGTGLIRIFAPGNPQLGYTKSGTVVGTSGTGTTVDLVCNLAAVDVAADLASLQNTALIKARSNLKDQDVDLGTAFGERDQTARMLGDTAVRIAKTVKALRRGQVRNAMNLLGLSSRRQAPRGSNWTKNWLELQYGWKPFLSDIHGACDALSKRGKDDWSVVAKGSASLKTHKQVRVSMHDAECAYQVASKYELGAFVRIDAYLGGGVTHSLASLGILNPLNVAWELVPLSFVVDWALPIGSWLSSLDAGLGLTLRGFSSTTYNRSEITGSAFNDTDGPWKSEANWSVTKRQLQVLRTVSGSIPLPSFPSLKDPGSLGHMANGLALLSQAFGRH